MTEQQQLLKQINNSEAACKLYLQECHKLKELLGGVYPSTPRKGSEYTPEMAAAIRSKRRMRVLGNLKK